MVTGDVPRQTERFVPLSRQPEVAAPEKSRVAAVMLYGVNIHHGCVGYKIIISPVIQNNATAGICFIGGMMYIVVVPLIHTIAICANTV